MLLYKFMFATQWYMVRLHYSLLIGWFLWMLSRRLQVISVVLKKEKLIYFSQLDKIPLVTNQHILQQWIQDQYRTSKSAFVPNISRNSQLNIHIIFNTHNCLTVWGLKGRNTFIIICTLWLYLSLVALYHPALGCYMV